MMNAGFMAMVSKRNCIESSLMFLPKAVLGSSTALQQTPALSQERISRSAFSS